MSKLRDAVKKASKYKKRKAVAKSNRPPKKGDGYYKVKVRFAVRATYTLDEVVVAKDEDDAVAFATLQFQQRKANENIKIGERDFAVALKVENVSPQPATKVNKPQLSETQRNVLTLLDRGFKLYPGWGKSYQIKASADTKIIEEVSFVTIRSLWRRGFITTPELLMSSENERRAQTVLGTLPSGKVLVIDRKTLQKFGITLNKKKKGK